MLDPNLTKTVFKKAIPKKVEWDFNVPDSKRDILKILSQTVEGTVTEYDVKENSFNLKLQARANVLYIPEGEEDPKLTALESTEVMVIKTEIPTGAQWDFTDISLNMVNSQPILINSRKIGVRCNANIDIAFIKNMALPAIDCAEEEIETKNKEIHSFSTAILVCEKINVSLNAPLPSGKPAVCEILSTDFCVKNKDLKAIANKAVLKGDLEVKMLYNSVENTSEMVEFVSPFTEIVDVAGLSDELDIEFETKLFKNEAVASDNENGESRNVSVNGFVELKIRAVKPECLTVTIDAYSPIYADTCKRDMLEYEEMSNIMSDNMSVKEVIYFDDFDISEIVSISALPVIKKAEICGNRVDISGMLETTVIMKNNTDLSAAVKEIEFTYQQDGFSGKAYDDVSINADIAGISYNIAGNNCIEVRANVMLNTRLRKMNKLEYICGINLDYEKKHDVSRAPIVAYFVKEGDTLFKIAKKYRTTVFKLKEINGIEDENIIKIGQYLLIE